MPKYLVIFENKEMISLERAPLHEATPTDSAYDGPTGAMLTATIDAPNEQEAYTKAKKLQTELQTGLTKEQLGPR